MDEFFVSDVAMLDEEEEVDVLGEVADPSEIFNGVDKISIYLKAQDYVDKLQVCGLSEDMPFQLVSDAIALLVDIEDKIVDEYNFIRDCYRLKFPELESLVHHPLDYARLVKIISNETDDMTRISSHLNQAGFLSPAMIMVISITASNTSGTPLPQEVLARTLEACDRAIELDSIRLRILDFVETWMLDIAPNISALAGSATAAKLITAAGSLEDLAKTPACNVQLLGAPKNTNLAGFSSELRVGYIDQTEVFRSTPPCLRGCVSRALALKLSLAARVDFVRGDSTGQIGRKFLEEIRKKIDKFQEPPVAKIQKKSLPVPGSDSRNKKKRGGKRLRNTKERYKVTKIKQLANRVKFNVPEESSLGDGGLNFQSVIDDSMNEYWNSELVKVLEITIN